MKIGILTQPLGHNYGGILQNYALQRVLTNLGHKPMTIKHHGLKKLISLKHNLYAIAAYIIKNIIRHPTRQFNQLPWDSRPYGNMIKFVRKNIERTKFQPEISDRTFAKYGFDAIFVGSDQVWRPKYNGEYLKYMFGDFSCQKYAPALIAYAASFGCCKWEYSPDETKKAKHFIKKFKCVSVREDSAVELCRKYLDTQATHVLDPTLLLDAKDYNSLIPQRLLQKFPDEFVGVYILDLTDHKKEIIDQICHFIGKQPYYFGEIDSKTGQYQSVELWLGSINRSSFIITDSFHGTAFSINYRKPFISIINHDRGADRFSSLLRMVGLEERMIEEENLQILPSLVKTPINWDSVTDKLDALRSKSMGFLSSNLT